MCTCSVQLHVVCACECVYGVEYECISVRVCVCGVCVYIIVI